LFAAHNKAFLGLASALQLISTGHWRSISDIALSRHAESASPPVYDQMPVWFERTQKTF